MNFFYKLCFCHTFHAALLGIAKDVTFVITPLLSPAYTRNFSLATSCNLSHQPKSCIVLHVKMDVRLIATFILQPTAT